MQSGLFLLNTGLMLLLSSHLDFPRGCPLAAHLFLTQRQRTCSLAGGAPLWPGLAPPPQQWWGGGLWGSAEKAPIDWDCWEREVLTVASKDTRKEAVKFVPGFCP